MLFEPDINIKPEMKDCNHKEEEYVDENLVQVGMNKIRMTKSQKMQYERTKNMPYNLLKQFSHKNERKVEKKKQEDTGGHAFAATEDEPE